MSETSRSETEERLDPETADRLDRATGVYVAHRELLFGVETAAPGAGPAS